MQNPWDMIRGN